MTALTSGDQRRKTRRTRPRRSPAGLAPWEERPSPAGRLGKGTLLTLIVLIVLGPLYTIVLTSLSSSETVNRVGGLVLVPDGITFEAYRQIFSDTVVSRAVLVSTLVTLAGTAVSTAVSVLGAYSLSRTGSFLHRPLLFSILLMFVFFPGIIPVYLMVSGLGLKDTYWSLILPTAVSAFNVVVLRSFFMNVPGEILDSARIDGAGEFRILFRIVLPMSKAVTAVVAMFYAVGYWNAWFNAMLYIDDTRKWPLALILRQYVVDSNPLPSATAGVTGDAPPTLAIKMAIVVIAVIPALILYPFVQRHFTKGVIVGAIKG
ncbi:carbohydrate ABC transporter permease [Nonomuraea jiangxiensis]|uniref:Putative aldouronate transport system permease protein n=1 Tax=Nonomuraea jiangxiensis TaxID=633440 RepID=A0A1G8FML9_9ACTN|nr:carbohydrate ABC transporter permease [Nonomuraea jiangxiensis]SDH83349.1 putative aldouronate transport system permease protein [Nonomuraea jiangxiensis]